MKNFIVVAGIVSFVGASLMSTSVFAGEAEDLAKGIKCKEAKGVIKMTQKFDKLKPAKKDSVSTLPEMRLITRGGGKMPKRVYYRNGAQESDFKLTDDGRVTDFARIRTMDKNGEMCLQSPDFIGKTKGETGVGLSLDFNVLYKNRSGHHTMAELLDGVGDGKSHYKKMFPGPLAVMVPKMTHVGVEYERGETADQTAAHTANVANTLKPTHHVTQIYATKAGKNIQGLAIEEFGGMYVIGIDALQSLGADGLAIKGGAYRLTPIPSIEKMKKLGFADGDEEAAENKKEASEK